MDLAVRSDRDQRALTLAMMLLLIFTSGCRSTPARTVRPLTAPQKYLRATTNSDGSFALDVAVRGFRPERRPATVIWLVAVTHLGTSNYFAGLQRLLDAQALVLFEGVGATNGDFHLQRDKAESLQQALAAALGLRFQLEAIDYRRSRFRNSDLTLAQIQDLLAAHAGSAEAANARADEGGREFSQLLQLLEGSGLAGALARVTMGLVGGSPRLQALVKFALIGLFGDLPGDLTGLQSLPPGLQRLLEVLVAERNKRVISDLQAALRQRPAPKSVAVFYGAGHMPDLERRLRTALPCQPAEERWLTSFAVNPRAEGLTELELHWVRELVRRQLEGLGVLRTSSDKLLGASVRESVADRFVAAPAFCCLPGCCRLGMLDCDARDHPGLDGSR